MKKQTKRTDLISSPSNFFRAVLCRGSAALEEQAPQGATSPAAERGKALHAALASRIEATYNGKAKTATAPKGEAEALDIWTALLVENINTRLSTGDLPTVRSEVEVNLQHLGFDHRGFADYLITCGDTAWVVDFKTGPGPYPAPSEDWQLRLYVMGLMPAHTKVKRWGAAFFAPERQDGRPAFDAELLEPARLEGLLDVVEQVLAEARQPGADLTPSLQACRFCKAKSLCPAILQEPAVSGALSVASPALRFAPGMSVQQYLTDATPAQRAKFLEGLGLAENWVDSAKEAALAAAQGGAEFEGFEVRSFKTDRVWTDEVEAEQALLTVWGPQAYEKRLLTPAAALKKAGDKDAFAHLITERPSKPGLYPVKKGKKS